MSKTIKCPYYIVNSLEEFNAALKAMGHGQKEPLYNFPCIVGYDDRVFQCSAGPLGPVYADANGTMYEYVLQTL